MLEVQQLTVNYRGVRGLAPLSFQVGPGQLVGIIGPNGAGKSTLLKALLGLVPASSGVVHYCTCPLHQQLERVAYIPQRSQIDWDYPITVWNVVMMAWTRQLGWLRSPSQAARETVKAALERVEKFQHHLNQSCFDLVERQANLSHYYCASGPTVSLSPAFAKDYATHGKCRRA